MRRKEGVFAGRRGRRFLGLTSPRRAVLGFVRFVEDEAVVEFGRWNIDADFGQGEDGARSWRIRHLSDAAGWL